MFFGPSTGKNSRSHLNHLRSIRYWHRPIGGIGEVVKKMTEVGCADPTQLDTSYVELYAGSLLAIGLQESENQDFWIAKPVADPPDMAFMMVDNYKEDKFLFRCREVEIIRYKYVWGDLKDQILKKDKNYPGDYIILCFIEDNGSDFLDCKKISDELKKELKNVTHVFLVFHGVILSPDIALTPLEVLKNDLFSKVSVVQLLPVYDQKVFDFKEYIKTSSAEKIKLIYTHNAKVYYGLREGDSEYPSIINNGDSSSR